MSVRHITFALLGASPELVTMFGSRMFDANALGTPTDKQIPAKPFLVTNYGEDSPALGQIVRVEDRTVDVWVYGEPSDFTIVERGLRLVREALHDASGVFHMEGGVKTWLVSSRYTGGSRDLYDDVYRANTRYGTYRLISNTP